jgi:hypothetical protein
MNTIDAILFRDLFIAGVKALEDKKDYVNELNVFPVPDGDTGTNMTMTLKAAEKEVLALEDVTMENVCRAISSGSLRGARGNSGVILSQLLRGFTKSIRNLDDIDVNAIADGFVKAVESAYKAVMKPKEGTILTVAKAGAYIAAYLADQNLDPVTYTETVITYMREVLDKTPDMLPVLKEAGVVDSGGEGLLAMLEGVHAALAGKLPKLSGVEADLSDFDKEGFMDMAAAKEKRAKGSDKKNSDKKSQDKKYQDKKGQDKKYQDKRSDDRKYSEKIFDNLNKFAKRVSRSDISTSDIRFRYCTEYIILLETDFDKSREKEFKIFLEAIGDSIVVVADDDIVKVHVHTNMPGIAIQKGLTYGSLTSMKIDNMQEEHNETIRAEVKESEDKESEKSETLFNGTTIIDSAEANDVPDESDNVSTDSEKEEPVSDEAVETVFSEIQQKDNTEAPSDSYDDYIYSENSGDETTDYSEDEDYSGNEYNSEYNSEFGYGNEYEYENEDDIVLPRKSVGFITVSAGEGLSEIFAGLGADIVIEGGQTMNPSTEDMLDAIDKINADTIFILPNNSNIILASQQAASIEEEKDVIVIPSKTIPQGIMAMLNYMANKTVEENEETMKTEMKKVKSGAITYSIRDTVVQGIDIRQGDIMGISESKILNVGAQVAATTVDLIENLMDEESELVSLYYGMGTTEDEANLIADTVRRKHPDIDVEVHYGGQPVYYYYLSVE